eukprot:6593497-Karenia_brevis.AAC.1
MGLPAVEINHPFHFKMTPSMMLGPQCNHDLGILLRVGRNSSAQQARSETSPEQSQQSQVDLREAARNAMLEAMGDNEYYCATYSSKDQPHID